MSKSPKVNLLTLTIGGNNLGFADIITKCIYQPERKFDYGPEYPAPGGACYAAIELARTRIEGFRDYIDRTVRDAIGHQRRKPIASDPFHLFLTGYVQFFNSDTTDCNDWSFGA